MLVKYSCIACASIQLKFHTTVWHVTTKNFGLSWFLLWFAASLAICFVLSPRSKYSWDIAGANGTQALAYIPFTLTWSSPRETLGLRIFWLRHWFTPRNRLHVGKRSLVPIDFPGQHWESSRWGRQGPGNEDHAAHVTSFTCWPFPGQCWCTFKYPTHETISDSIFLCSLAIPNSSKIPSSKVDPFH